jgi:dTDP-4-amino-4,6-dideoxygalactose transaminase
LPFAPPLIGEEEIAEVVDTLRSSWITTGPKTRQFESDFAARVQAPGALAVSSCTAALHTALVTAGIGPGDEVITTPMTFAASVNVIEHVGARPVLVDVEPDTLNIDPKAVDAAVSARTRAILAVHYAGHPADLDALWAIADTHKCMLIEDAAHALPARYRGRPIGGGDRGNPVAFSFYATKNLTTAEGGMLTASPDFLAQARIVSLHGMRRDAWKRYDKGGSWFYEIMLPGFKYNMTDIQAALGLWQLRKLARFQERRAEIIAQYNSAFANEPALSFRRCALKSTTPGTSTCCGFVPAFSRSAATDSFRSWPRATSARRCISFRFTSIRTTATAMASCRRPYRSPTETTSACSACRLCRASPTATSVT